MFIQAIMLGLFGLVITLVGLLIGLVGSVLLLFFRKGVQGDTKNLQAMDIQTEDIVQTKNNKKTNTKRLKKTNN
jgi:hypothetical protein